MEMIPKLRVARATNNLEKISEMYRLALNFSVLGSFVNHDNFDGIIIGSPKSSYHLEFTQQKGHAAPLSPSPESLLVFYHPAQKEWENKCNQMIKYGFKSVPSNNPYWDLKGRTFEDPEGYRVVLYNFEWTR